jgi:uncharacterized protein YcfL
LFFGNNEHGTFKVKLKNASNHDLKIIMAITGGTHSVIVKPNETISVQAKSILAVVENKSNETASVDLRYRRYWTKYGIQKIKSFVKINH